MVRGNTLTFTFCLLAVGSALPATSSSSTLAMRRWTDCPTGTSYYTCFGKSGCFASDPCINPPTQSQPALSTSASASPTPSIAFSITTKDQKLLYPVFPAKPEDKSQSNTTFEVRSGKGQTEINSVGVFTGIPAKATQCWLGWKNGAINERIFSVKGNGLVSAVQLDKLDTSKGVSWSDVQKANEISAEAGPDFTSWDTAEYPKAAEHGSWPLKCAETIYMKFETDKRPENVGVGELRDVSMVQDDKNGWEIKYYY